MRKEQIMVVPFNQHRGDLQPDIPIPAKTAEGGIAKAERIANQFDGVGVYRIWVDDITFDASDLEELFRIGDVPSLEMMSAAA